MLFCTSLLALVGAADQPQSSPRKLQIVNTKVRDTTRSILEVLWRLTSRISIQRQSMICELLFPSSILAVKLNRKTLVIVLEVEIYIYDISNMRLLHVIETTPNPDGECSRVMFEPTDRHARLQPWSPSRHLPTTRISPTLPPYHPLQPLHNRTPHRSPPPRRPPKPAMSSFSPHAP